MNSVYGEIDRDEIIFSCRHYYVIKKAYFGFGVFKNFFALVRLPI